MGRRGGSSAGDLLAVWCGPAILTVAVALLGAAPALAVQRYAAPSAVGSQDCSSPVNACTVDVAIEHAANGDEVIVAPGYYAGTRALTSTIQTFASNLYIHGLDSGPGEPSARIYMETPTYGVELDGSGSRISDLEIVDTGTGAGDALSLRGGTAERMVVRAGPQKGGACMLLATTTLRDSLCDGGGITRAIDVSATVFAPNQVTIRNVTAISQLGTGIEVTGGPGRPSSVTVVNTIVRGGTIDIEAYGVTTPASVTTSHSNYLTTRSLGEGTISDDGTSQIMGAQPAAQLFVNPLFGDYHQLVGAATIAAGVVDPSNGSVDFDGDPRVFDAGGPCESTDIGADQFTPAQAPVVVTGAAEAVSKTTATVRGTSNPASPLQVVHFDYGPAAPGGGSPASFSSSAPQCLRGAVDSPQPASATLTGLRPGTTYFYRLVAGNGAGATTPAFTATFRTAGSPPSSATAPTVSGATRIGSRLATTTGTWSGTGPITYTYQWQRCRPSCTPIASATASRYTLTGADAGARIRVAVTAHNTLGSATATSAAVGPVTPTPAQIQQAIRKLLRPRGKEAKIPALLRRGGYRYSVTPATAGSLTISWYQVPKGAHVAKRQPLLVARARHNFPTRRAARFTCKLTRPGRALLARSQRVRLTAVGSFTVAVGPRTSATVALTLTR